MTPSSGEADRPAFDLDAAKRLIREASRVRDSNTNETVTRQTLVAGLADVFPIAIRPWWIRRHISGAEAQVRFLQAGQQRRGFVDSVVGLTAIEYEYDLRQAARFTTGKMQVQQYCAGLLNEGAAPEKVRGVLSDGVEWRAYEVAVPNDITPGQYDVADVVLNEIEHMLCAAADDRNATLLVEFLLRHLGREGTRPLTAPSIADYLGFDSGFGEQRLAEFDAVVTAAMQTDSASADVVREIWSSFVAYLSVDPAAVKFHPATYVQEFYLAILARLMCANVISRHALRSDESELDRILDGRFFETRGLLRLVEYDYFGWLTSDRHVADVRAVAAELQGDLAAYDYDASPQDDLFGQLLASLAERTHRLLLGQEWTPAWLALDLAARLFDKLPGDEAPHFVDMCCGSGSMIVAVTRMARVRLAAAGVAPGSAQALDYLVHAATGFDIDPLAVTLAKVNWVVTNRDWLEPFDGSHRVTLPLYHADSLFALAPVFDEPGDEKDATAAYVLRLLDERVTLPRFLVSPSWQVGFDALLEAACSLAMHLADHPDEVLEDAVVEGLANEAVGSLSNLSLDEQKGLLAFVRGLVTTMADLQRAGKNGIWVFVIRNSYRPGLVAGQFNGLISNPPWLAMSKIGSNPFGDVLKNRAARYGLTAPGSAFPHLEMATTFLAHAVEHYLADDAVIACILPDTIRNGAQHLPFRAQLGRFNGTKPMFQMALDELWKIDAGVFKNRGAIVFGHRADPVAFTTIDGELVRDGASDAITHYVAGFGDRMVWSPNPPGEGVPGAYPAGFASQGADVMPRRLLMVTAVSLAQSRCQIRTPTKDADDWYLVSDAKKHTNFSISPRSVPDWIVHRCLLSKNVGPFVIADPGACVLPIRRTERAAYRRASAGEIAASPGTGTLFDELITASDFGTLDDFWENGLDYRSKLSRQVFPAESCLVVYGAGGGIPAAACAQVACFGDQPPVVDQTLYWAVVDSEDEALFICALINSEALLSKIEDFIPEGDFGDRHLHTLPSRAVPQFDPADDAHVAIVDACRLLVAGLNACRADEKYQPLFTNEMSMPARRNRLRKLLRTLDSYDGYEAACATLYGEMTGD